MTDDHELNVASQLKTAKEALNNIAFQLGFQSFDNEKVEIAIESLLAAKASNEAKVEECDRQIEKLETDAVDMANVIADLEDKLDERDRAISNYKLELEDRDRNIAILEDNLNRARSEHLKQLNAISQYLEQFGGFPIYLLTKVVYANIEKLDPRLQCHPN